MIFILKYPGSICIVCTWTWERLFWFLFNFTLTVICYLYDLCNLTGFLTPQNCNEFSRVSSRNDFGMTVWNFFTLSSMTVWNFFTLSSSRSDCSYMFIPLLNSTYLYHITSCNLFLLRRVWADFGTRNVILERLSRTHSNRVGMTACLHVFDFSPII